MIQSHSKTPAQIERFRIAPWPFQQTFQTPLKELQCFIKAFSKRFSLERSALNTDDVVFEPEHLLELLARSSIKVENRWKFTLSADSSEEGASLLLATLSDSIDFCLVPQSEGFAIYADHDEFITFYAPDGMTLDSIRSSLAEGGFDPVDYVRQRSDRSWK